MKRKRIVGRIVAIMMAIALVTGLVPDNVMIFEDFIATASAAGSSLGGAGTAANPWKISSTGDWITFASNAAYMSGYVKLTKDIDISSMVGTESAPFKGTFDGNGYTLNASIESSAPFAAPFRYVEGATIKNLIVSGTIRNTERNGSAGYTGGIVGCCLGNVTIDNVNVSAAVKSYDTHNIGGFIGHARHAVVNIRNSAFTGNLVVHDYSWGDNRSVEFYVSHFVGWGESDCRVNINRCICDPSAKASTGQRTGWFDLSVWDFVCTQNNVTNITTTDCYYTGNGESKGKGDDAVGVNQGTPISTTQPGGNYITLSVFDRDYYLNDNGTVVQPPTILPSRADNTIESNEKITITAVADADIYYTTDGSEPTENSAKYTGAFSIRPTRITPVMVRAIAIKDGDESFVSARRYFARDVYDVNEGGLSHITGDGGYIALSSEDYVTALTPEEGYYLPVSVTVTIGEETAVEGTAYTYDNESGELIIKKEFITNDIAITAEAYNTYFTVTFDMNGKTGIAPESITGIKKGRKITAPTALTAENVFFHGWYTDADGTVPFDFDTPITEDITLYAHWQDPMSYIDADGVTKTTDANIISSSSRTLNTGWYIVNDDITIDGILTCLGDVKLILADGSSLTVNGIIVNSGNSFTVYGQSGQSGVLRSEPTTIEDRSGIGGEPGSRDNFKTGGNITINGGIVIASGGKYGAGIGGNHFCHSGNITINGGTVTAAGGSEGAGIGGGSSGNGGNIVINGGSVKAMSGGSAYNIGGGLDRTPVTPTNGTENVYRIEIDNEFNQNITIDGQPLTPTQHITGNGTENKVYAYVTGKDHEVIINGEVKYNYTWNSQNSTFTKSTSHLVTLHKNDGTEDTKTQWVAENAAIANPFKRTGYAVLEWYDNENLSGEPVTTFNAANNNRDFWAKWKYDGKALNISSANELITFVKEYNEGIFTYSSELVVTQTADIDLNGIAWTPFNTFSGTYNGNGHAIRNMKKGNGGDDLAWPFALTNRGTICNLTFDGASVFRHAKGGSAVVAVDNNGTIENVIVKNSTVQLGNYDNLAGIAATGSGTIRNCAVINTNLMRRYSSTKSAAAIIEANSGTVENCLAYGCTSNASTINGMVSSGNAPTNSYYYMTATSGSSVDGTKVTSEQMSSGEVANRLGAAWGQIIGTDSYPIPDGTKVYKVTFKNGETTIGTAYTNGTVTYIGETPSMEGFIFKGWVINSNGTGDVVTTVTEDITLYAKLVALCNITVTSKDTEGNNVAAALEIYGASTATGTYTEGAEVTVVAPVVTNYTFQGWYEKADSSPGYTEHAISTARSYRFSATQGKDLVAVYKGIGNVNITINGGGSNYTVNGGDATSTQTMTAYQVGSTLKIKVLNTEDFDYWENAAGMIVSRNPEYSFTVSVADTLTAVYNKPAEGKMIVVWESSYGQVMGRVEGNADTIHSATVPALPTRFGYDVTGWDTDVSTLTFAAGTLVTIRPVETKMETVVNVSVTNGTKDKNSYLLNDVVTVTANAPEAGKKFSHWTDGAGKIISYNSTYIFYITEDVSLTANYVDDEVAVEEKGIAQIISTSYDADKKYLNIVSMLTEPDNCTMNFAGLVATSNSEAAANLTKENAAFVRGTANTGNKSYRYSWTKSKVEAGTVWYVRAYLVYTNASGEVIEVYGDLQTVTAGNN